MQLSTEDGEGHSVDGEGLKLKMGVLLNRASKGHGKRIFFFLKDGKRNIIIFYF